MHTVVEPTQTADASTTPLQAIFEASNLKALIGGMKSIPTLPTLYSEVMKELKSGDPSLGRIGQIIAKDLGMAARLLRVVNSSYFAVPKQITSPSQATMLLGLDTTKGLLLSLGVFVNLDKVQIKGFSANRLWEHSLKVGLWAGRIAESEGLDKNLIDEAFTAGLLHDIGTLGLVMNKRSEYLDVMEQIDDGTVPLETAERNVFESSHGELGAYLVNTWGLSEGIAEAVAFHHNPVASGKQEMSPLTAVYVADILEYASVSADDGPSQLDTDHAYLDLIGKSDRVATWREICKTPTE